MGSFRNFVPNGFSSWAWISLLWTFHRIDKIFLKFGFKRANTVQWKQETWYTSGIWAIENYKSLFWVLAKTTKATTTCLICKGNSCKFPSSQRIDQIYQRQLLLQHLRHFSGSCCTKTHSLGAKGTQILLPEATKTTASWELEIELRNYNNAFW